MFSVYLKKILLTCVATYPIPLLCGVQHDIDISSPPSTPSTYEKCVSVEGLHINFTNVPMQEFLRFVSKTCNVNFIYDHQDLLFSITLHSGKPVKEAEVLRALVQIFRIRGLYVMEQEGYLVIHKSASMQMLHEATIQSMKGLSASNDDDIWLPFVVGEKQFMVYKLQYQQGSDIEVAVKKIGTDLQTQNGDCDHKLARAIQSLQWVKATNSMVATGDDTTLHSLKQLITRLDVPLKQVFIEVLVIETNLHNGVDFGLEWAAGGKWTDRLGFGIGNFPPGKNHRGFGSSVQSTTPSSLPTGLNQIPLGGGFDLGVIGNIILHRGASYLSLGSLVSALQTQKDTTIVLNQKIITQDGQNSRIFVGENIPFTGSVVQTVGASQQTSSNIEYRDIGVSLSITPMLGEGEVISLDIRQEITEELGALGEAVTLSEVNAIRTTKTEMSTRAHVPDQHFLILTGMVRNHRVRHKAGIPCLGGLPVVGAAFSKNVQQDEKRHVVVFVYPQIIHSYDEYEHITKNQKNLYRRESMPGEFDRGLRLVETIDTSEDTSDDNPSQTDHDR